MKDKTRPNLSAINYHLSSITAGFHAYLNLFRLFTLNYPPFVTGYPEYFAG